MDEFYLPIGVCPPSFCANCLECVKEHGQFTFKNWRIERRGGPVDLDEHDQAMAEGEERRRRADSEDALLLQLDKALLFLLSKEVYPVHRETMVDEIAHDRYHLPAVRDLQRLADDTCTARGLRATVISGYGEQDTAFDETIKRLIDRFHFVFQPPAPKQEEPPTPQQGGRRQGAEADQETDLTGDKEIEAFCYKHEVSLDDDFLRNRRGERDAETDPYSTKEYLFTPERRAGQHKNASWKTTDKKVLKWIADHPELKEKFPIEKKRQVKRQPLS